MTRENCGPAKCGNMCNCIHPIHSVATESSFACNISIYFHHKCISIFFYVMDWPVLLNQGCMHVEWKHLTRQTAHFIPVIRERIWGQKTCCQVRCRWALLGGSATPRSRRNQVPTPTLAIASLSGGCWDIIPLDSLLQVYTIILNHLDIITEIMMEEIEQHSETNAIPTIILAQQCL